MPDDPTKETLPGGLTRAELEELDRTNPVRAARYRAAHGAYQTEQREEQTAAPSPNEDPRRATHRELDKINPALAARYRAANRLY